MAFSQSTITSGPVATRDGVDTLITWSCSDPSPTFQVYLDRRLAWHGTKARCRVAVPPDGAAHELAVGTCLPFEAHRDLSAALPPPIGGAGNRAELAWLGGTFLGDRIDHFRVYRGPSAGAVSPTSGPPLAVVAAYAQGVILDGYGLGGYGEGGFGRSATPYGYTGAPLPSGTWHFAVVPVDDAGNAGPPAAFSVDLAGPPPAPLAGTGGARVAAAYDAATRQATLSWTPA